MPNFFIASAQIVGTEIPATRMDESAEAGGGSTTRNELRYLHPNGA